MGNHLACLYVVDSPVVKLADLDGNVHEFGYSRSVAELMIEFPCQIVMPADELRRDHRVWAMKADMETKIGQLYVLFPINRFNSRVSDDEIAELLSSQYLGQKAGGAKVFPTSTVPSRDETVVAPKTKMEEIVSPVTRLAMTRLQNQQRWRPELQSINELKCTV